MAKHSSRSASSPLSERQRELRQREEALRREMERMQNIIHEAPKLVEEVRRREQEALIERAHTDYRRADPFRSIGEDGTAVRRGRQNKTQRVSLKAERNAQRTQFILLLLLLAVLCLIVLSRLPG